MKCYNCGQLLPDDSEFCQYCGYKIENEAVNEIVIKDEQGILEKPIKQIEIVKEQKSKIRFCKMCGSQIDAQTKKCSGCGKQYFKGIKFNKFLITVLILCVAMLTSVIFNIIMLIKIDTLNENNELYNEIMSDLKKDIRKKDESLHFYEDYAAIVGGDSKTYHIYGCDELDDTSFYIYNVSTAKNKGYHACSKCIQGKTASQRALEKLNKKYGLD